MSFPNFPKRRRSLSSEERSLFQKVYEANRKRAHGFSFVSFAERWMHQKIASRARENECVLELGAGTLNHLPFENKFTQYDIVEPWKDLWSTSVNQSRVSNTYENIQDLPLSVQYDRIVSVATLEHIEDLPRLIEKSLEHLKPGALFQAAIPSEGAFLWGLAWRITTAPLARIRYGVNYSHLMAYEHINSALEIEEVMRFYFKEVRVERFPVQFFHTSLYTYLEATKS